MSRPTIPPQTAHLSDSTITPSPRARICAGVLALGMLCVAPACNPEPGTAVTTPPTDVGDTDADEGTCHDRDQRRQ